MFKRPITNLPAITMRVIMHAVREN